MPSGVGAACCFDHAGIIASMTTRNGLWQMGADQLATLLQTLRTWPWFETARTLRQRFREDRLGITASSLTFTTLIALVPLLTVMLALFSAFPMFTSSRVRCSSISSRAWFPTASPSRCWAP